MRDSRWLALLALNCGWATLAACSDPPTTGDSTLPTSFADAGAFFELAAPQDTGGTSADSAARPPIDASVGDGDPVADSATGVDTGGGGDTAAPTVDVVEGDAKADAGLACTCGDGQCEPTCESKSTCPTDCGKACGDGICAPGEGPVNCPEDCCGGCGDGLCKGYLCGEDPESCPADCGMACGNKVCEKGESTINCAQDCVWQVCGNGVCEAGDGGPEGCPSDCGAACGNCLCEKSESWLSCPIDCGYCGDGFCSLCGAAGESLATCPEDCKGGQCKADDPTACEDDNPCTIDGCTEAGVCTHAHVKAPCDDDNACTQGDVCGSGVCLPGLTVDCDDDNPCTSEACVPPKGCKYLPVAGIETCYTGADGTQGIGACKPGAATCVDGKLGVCLGQITPSSESCNGVDDDCDGQTDPADTPGCVDHYLDGDGDGWGTGPAACLCAPDKAKKFTATKGGDCKDADPAIHPGQIELCNGADDDCVGGPDDSCICAKPGFDPPKCATCQPGYVATASGAGQVCAPDVPIWGIDPAVPNSLNDLGDGSVIDQLTKLQWTKGIATSLAFSAAEKWCQQQTAGGHKDWRLPTVAELTSIVDYSKHDPALPQAFAGAQPGHMWTAVPLVGESGKRWRVFFGNWGSPGGLTGYGDTTNTGSVRCVRAVQAQPGAPISRFTIDAAAGTVHDALTKRTWQRAMPAKTYTRLGAMNYCTGLQLAGSGWRLPDIRELSSIVDRQASPDPIDVSAFPGTPDAMFWSSNDVANEPTLGWTVFFYSGTTGPAPTQGTQRVRCVR